MLCAGRWKAIEDILTKVTIRTFCQGADSKEMTEEEKSKGLKHLKASGYPALTQENDLSTP